MVHVRQSDGTFSGIGRHDDLDYPFPRRIERRHQILQRQVGVKRDHLIDSCVFFPVIALDFRSGKTYESHRITKDVRPHNNTHVPDKMTTRSIATVFVTLSIILFFE